MELIRTDDREAAWVAFLAQIEKGEENVLLTTEPNEYTPAGVTHPVIFSWHGDTMMHHEYVNWKEQHDEIRCVESDYNINVWTDDDGRHWFSDDNASVETTEELELCHLYWSDNDGYYYKGSLLDKYCK